MNWNQRRRRLAVDVTVTYEKLSTTGMIGVAALVVAALQLIAVDLPEWRKERALKSQFSSLQHQPQDTGTAASQAAVAVSPLPEESELPGVLGDLARIAQDCDLVFPAAEYTWTAPSEASFGQYELQFEVKGSYLEIRHFIEEIENDEPAVAIRELSFTRDNAIQAQLRSKIRLVIFTQRHSA